MAEISTTKCQENTLFFHPILSCFFPFPQGRAVPQPKRASGGSTAAGAHRRAAQGPRGKAHRLGQKREVIGRAGPRRQAPLPHALGESPECAKASAAAQLLCVELPARRGRAPSGCEARDERDVTRHPRTASARQRGSPVPPCPHVVPARCATPCTDRLTAGSVNIVAVSEMF